MQRFIEPLQSVTSTAIVLVGFVWAVFAPHSAAELMEQASPYTDVIDVEVVGLEVNVTDVTGDPLVGLGLDDFELWADGELVEITNFYAVEGGRRLAGTERPESEPLFLVVFVDNVHMSTFGRNRVLEQLGPFLKQRLEEGDRVMVASFDGSVSLRQSFTNDWKAVRRTLEELASDAGFGHEREREHTRAIESILSLSDLHASLPAGSLRTRCPKEVESVARGYANQVYGRVDLMAERLGDFVETLGALPGRKAVLHVSDGLHLLPGVEVFEYLCQLCGGCARDATDIAQMGTPELPGDSNLASGGSKAPLTYDGKAAPLDGLASEATQVFARLTERANAHRVTFFALEAYGPRSLTPSSQFSKARTNSVAVERARIGSLRDSLVNMADRTGGRVVLDTLELAPRLARIGEDLDSYYSLGYRLPRSKEGRKFRVRVEARHPDAEVRYRKSLHTKPLSEQLADRTRASLMFGVGQNPLTIALEIGQPEALDKSLHMVPIRVHVPLEKVTLLSEQGLHRGRLTIYLAARDRAGRLAPVRSADVRIEISDDEIESARQKPYLYEIRMLMRQGDHSVSVGVHDEIGRLASFLLQDVLVSVR